MLTESETKLLDTITNTGATPTAAQLAVVKLLEDAGYVLKKDTVTMIGSKLWVNAERKWVTEDRPDGNVFLDEMLYGTVGARGALNLTFDTFGYRTKVTEPWHLRSRIERGAGHKAPAPATEAATA